MPVAHLKKLYGRSVMVETIEAMIQEANAKIVEERGLKLAKALGNPGLEIGSRDLDVEYPLEAVGNAFCDLHGDLHVLAVAAAFGFDIGSCDIKPCPDGRGAGGGTRTPTTFVTGT